MSTSRANNETRAHGVEGTGGFRCCRFEHELLRQRSHVEFQIAHCHVRTAMTAINARAASERASDSVREAALISMFLSAPLAHAHAIIGLMDRAGFSNTCMAY